MKRNIFLSTFSILLSLMIAVSAQAQNVFYVTANGGSDANACTRSAPCRQIQRGLTVTPRGGMLIVLDGGEYDPFTITKSVSLIAERGVRAVVASVSATAGATIDEDGTNSQIISMRGLTFVDGGYGIQVNANVTSLSIEECSISGTDNGVYVSGGGRYLLKDVTVAHTPFGVTFTPPSSPKVVAVIESSRFEHIGSIGVELRGVGSSLTISNSIASYNVTGFLATGSSKMVVENSVVNNNTYGITAESGASVSVGHSTIANNGTGFRNYSTTFRSFGNNSFSGNTLNTNGTISAVNQQ